MNDGPPLVVASRNGDVGITAAIETLRAGGTAIDAIEAGIHVVESNRGDTSVGLGGLPNLLGQVELDASIMDGSTRAAGAVGAVHGYEHPITIARRVMEDLPHVTLVGPGAEQFAASIGMPAATLLTPETRALRTKHMEERLNGDITAIEALQLLSNEIDPDPAEVTRFVKRMLNPHRNTGTVNFIARDQQGNIASGVSTSGWEWKHPGRLGDTPIIGGGNYADGRFGAATCTGHGEVTTRCGTARSVVLHLQRGLSVRDAVEQAALDTEDLDDPHSGGVEILAMSAGGDVAAAMTGPPGTDETRNFVLQTTDMATFEVRSRELVTSSTPS